jgi:hypothetical protein
MTKKQLYSRLVLSLVEMSIRQRKRRGRRRSRNQRRRDRQAAEAEAEAQATPTNPADVGPQNRSEQPPSPTNPPPTPSPTGDDIPPAPGTANDPDGNPITPDEGDKKGTPEQEVSMRGTKGIARATAAAGERGSILSRLANRYADTLPDKSDSADKIRNFSRGVTKIGAGTASLIRKGLNKGKNVPLGGKSLV